MSRFHGVVATRIVVGDRVKRIYKTGLVAVAVCVAVGCGRESEGAADTDTDTESSPDDPQGTGGTSGTASTRGGGTATGVTSNTTSGETDGAETGGDDGPPPEGTLAAGIIVEDVEINQGVGVAVAAAGEVVAADERIAPIVAGRPALVRASYSLEPGFESRNIVGRLWLRDAQDNHAVYVDERVVTEGPDWTTLDGTFHWVVEPDDLTGDTEFRVQLLEPDMDEPNTDAAGAQVPATGFAPLEAWGDPMRIELVVVPFQCSGVPDLDLDPSALDDFEAYLFNTYAVQTLEMTLHDPVSSSSCSEFDAAEFDLPALRDSEGAQPWVYYGGLLPGGGGGYAVSIDGGEQMDHRRTFASHDWRDFGLTFDLFAHELAHSHGRAHSFEDPSYPGDASGGCGGIDTWGWGARSSFMPSSAFSNDVELGLEWFDPHAQLLPPTSGSCTGMPEGNRWNFNDITSYEYPFWVSAYTYARSADRIRLLSSWSEAAVVAPPGKTYRVVVGPEGKIHHTVRDGARPVVAPTAWAQCGEQRLPVRVGHAVHDLPTRGRVETHTYVTYELPLAEGVQAQDCELETDSISFRTNG